MKGFYINKYLSVRLEGQKTVIYVAGTPFFQCKHLLLNIPVTEEKFSSFSEIKSVDDAVEKEIEIKENRDLGISPEMLFWGHCSNLHAWYEHGYDTRLLHSNLAFPLLEKLCELGDSRAKKVFRNEIIKRFRNGTEVTRAYLSDQDFLRYITVDEQINALVNTENYMILMDFVEEIWPTKDPYKIILDLFDTKLIKLYKRKIIEINLPPKLNLNLRNIPKMILGLRDLETLSLGNNSIKNVPEEICKLGSLRKLFLDGNEIYRLPKELCSMTKLEKIWLHANRLQDLPHNIGNLKNLQDLTLDANILTELPESIGNLKSLKFLSVSSNKLIFLPKSFHRLESLKELSVEHNNLEELPEFVELLPSLEYLNIKDNPIAKDPLIIERLKKVKLKELIVS
jgi:hypothetical protein